MFIDFCINYNNKQYFIEYNGIQHYEYTPYFHIGGIIDFEKQIRRDKVLEDYCNLNENKTTLIKFNYKQTNEEIIKLLSGIFK